MPLATDASVRLTVATSFLPGFFLENIAIRHDNSMLITVLTRNELWYVPPPRMDGQVDPMLIHKFDELVSAVVEIEPDVFIVCTANFYTTHENYLHRLDLRGWTPGQEAKPQFVLQLPKEAKALNGACLVAPRIMFAADCFAGLVWRIDFAADGTPTARVWLKHDSMAHVLDNQPPPPQPGINGIRYDAKGKAIYYTVTGQKLFMRVRVDPQSFEPAGQPELVDHGRMADDFCIDEEAEVAYVTTHRENTIDRIPIGSSGGTRLVLAGEPLDLTLLGPSSIAWSRLPGEHGRVAYVTTDGGTTAHPPDGIVRSAKVLRMELSRHSSKSLE